jgi:serine/threonine protein kinase
VLIKKLEEQEAKAQGKKEEVTKKIEKHEKKWKMKFIKIWQYNGLRELEDSKNLEHSVGPNNFLPLMKLGQGSFGQVYLVEKMTVKADGSIVNSGKQYAMKILNKKQILGNNLVKYAKTERDVLSYTKHPFIVGLKYAF